MTKRKMVLKDEDELRYKIQKNCDTYMYVRITFERRTPSIGKLQFWSCYSIFEMKDMIQLDVQSFL